MRLIVPAPDVGRQQQQHRHQRRSSPPPPSSAVSVGASSSFAVTRSPRYVSGLLLQNEDLGRVKWRRLASQLRLVVCLWPAASGGGASAHSSCLRFCSGQLVKTSKRVTCIHLHVMFVFVMLQFLCMSVTRVEQVKSSSAVHTRVCLSEVIYRTER